MFRHTFKVRKSQKSEPVTFTADMPTTLDDVDLIEARYGTVERMIDRANSQWTVDVAVGIRKRLPDVEKAKAYAANYCDDGRKDTYAQPVVIDTSADDAPKFTPEQLAFIRKSGAQVA